MPFLFASHPSNSISIRCLYLMSSMSLSWGYGKQYSHILCVFLILLGREVCRGLIRGKNNSQTFSVFPDLISLFRYCLVPTFGVDTTSSFLKMLQQWEACSTWFWGSLAGMRPETFIFYFQLIRNSVLYHALKRFSQGHTIGQFLTSSSHWPPGKLMPSFTFILTLHWPTFFFFFWNFHHLRMAEFGYRCDIQGGGFERWRL